MSVGPGEFRHILKVYSGKDPPKNIKYLTQCKTSGIIGINGTQTSESEEA